MFIELLSVCIQVSTYKTFNFKQSTMPTLFEINSDETFFYPFTFSVNKCDVTLLMTHSLSLCSK